MAAPRRTTPTGCSSARRPWLWKRCWPVISHRRRELVPLTDALRQKTQAMADEMNQYFARGYTPKVKPGTFCNACSLKELCLPALYKRADPRAYLKAYLGEVQAEDTP